MSGPEAEVVEVLAGALHAPGRPSSSASLPGAVRGLRFSNRGSVSSPALLRSGHSDRAGGSPGEDAVAGGASISWLASSATPPSSRSSRLNNSPSRPGSSPQISRAGTGRFLAEELNCFKRVPTPSKSYETKQESYWQASGELREQFSQSSLHTLPVSKGNFFAHPKLKGTFGPNYNERTRKRTTKQVDKSDLHPDPLPEEEDVSRMLQELFPTSPVSKRSSEERHTPETTPEVARKTMARMHGTVVPRNSELGKASSSPAPTRHRKTSLQGHLLHRGGGGGATLDDSPGGQAHSHDAENAFHSPPSGHGTAHKRDHHSPGQDIDPVKGVAFPSGKKSHQERSSMYLFRKQLIDRYGSVKDAFETFRARVPVSRDLSKKEWRRFLSKQCEWLGKDDREAVLKHVNERDGHVSINDFHIGVEAAAPVRTFEGLRRRWLASGFTCMRHALDQLDSDWMVSQERYTVTELGEKLARVHVHDASEHAALFNGICSDRRRTVSIAELASAVASVSPIFLLEDLRDRMLTKYINLERCFGDLDADFDGTIDKHEFVTKCSKKLGMARDEAEKAFREIDIDQNGYISPSELMSAIALSEPSFFLEDLRLKIRQRFRSIQELFTRAYFDKLEKAGIQASIEGGSSGELELRLEHFQKLLKGVEIKESETKTLFHLFDVNHDGCLTIPEFSRGVWHFAPSCVLEDLRIRCCARHHHVVDAFAALEDRTKLLDFDSFTQTLVGLNLITAEEVAANPKGARERRDMLQKLQRRQTEVDVIENLIASVNPNEEKYTTKTLRVQSMFDLLDTRHAGTVSVGMLISALQSCGAGSKVRLSAEENNECAKQEITLALSDKRKKMQDLKTQLRSGLNWKEERTEHVGGKSYHGWDPSIWRDHGHGMVEAMVMRQKGSETESGEGTPNGSPASGSGSPSHAGRGSPNNAGRGAGLDLSKSGGTGTLRKTEGSGSPHHRGESPDGGGAAGGDGAGAAVEGGNGEQEDPKRAGPPRLRSKPAEELDTPHARNQAKHLDSSKPSQAAVAAAQQSWGNMWMCFRNNNSDTTRDLVEKETNFYYNTAAWTLSQDTPLVQGSPIYARAGWHRKKCDHWEALKANHLKSAPK